MNRFAVNDWVRVTAAFDTFDKVGRVTGLPGLDPYYEIAIDGQPYSFRESSLILADPPVHAVLDEMLAESEPVGHAATLKTMTQGLAAEMDAAQNAHRERVTATDKLRMIADTVDGQAPFGTELANFRRRLSAILSIGHDA